MKGHGELQGHERLLSHITMVDCFFSNISSQPLSQVMEQIPTVQSGETGGGRGKKGEKWGKGEFVLC